jgi:hypothetical protein
VFRRLRLLTRTVVVAAVASAALAACSSSSKSATTPTSTITASGPRTTTTTTISAATLAQQLTRPRAFVVTPAHLVVGGKATFSGTGCPASATVVIGIDDLSTGRGVFTQTTPAASGAWRTSAFVSDFTIPGTRTAHAACATTPDHETIFQYNPVRVQVTTRRAVHVQPGTTVHPGSTLIITETGGCPMGDAIVALQRPGTSIFNVEPTNPGGPVGFADFAPDATGAWHGRLVVPAKTTPGAYVLNVICVGPSRSFNAFYPLVPITVTAS